VLWIRIRLDPHSFGCPEFESVLVMWIRTLNVTLKCDEDSVRIRIDSDPWIRICTEEKSWIRIRFETNADPQHIHVQEIKAYYTKNAHLVRLTPFKGAQV
jgi:hypothetical protein